MKVSDLNPIEHLWEELDRRISDIKAKNFNFSDRWVKMLLKSDVCDGFSTRY